LETGGKRSIMKIAKEFSWEMGHSLPEHFGKCKNIHGHSYKMIVELEGDVDKNGMILDYFELKKIINPIVEELDHAFLVYKDDLEVISFLTKLNSKKVVTGFQSTVENICSYFLDKIKNSGLPSNIKSLKVRICETPDDYAEEEIRISG
jgi:6-pyruvoyltetrahydropterin/6-carboxytetrahydropterin synthase